MKKKVINIFDTNFKHIIHKLKVHISRFAKLLHFFFHFNILMDFFLMVCWLAQK